MSAHWKEAVRMKEYIVKSVSDYLAVLFAGHTQEFYHGVADLRVMYRGQANAAWNPIPGAFRNDEDFLNEGFYIREYERQMPQNSVGKSGIEILIDAQHYGMPTRLLDVTSNPLVALYFACLPSHDDQDADGAVLQFLPAGFFSQEELTCTVLAEYVRHYKLDLYLEEKWRADLCRIVSQTHSRFSADAHRAVDYMLSGEPIRVFFLPSYNNERIRAQEGAFLLFSTPYIKINDNSARDGRFLLPSEDGSDPLKNVGCKYIIPKDEKAVVLSQLDSIGINEARLFPDTEHQIKSIVETVRRVNKEYRESIARRP